MLHSVVALVTAAELDVTLHAVEQAADELVVNGEICVMYLRFLVLGRESVSELCTGDKFKVIE